MNRKKIMLMTVLLTIMLYGCGIDNTSSDIQSVKNSEIEEINSETEANEIIATGRIKTNLEYEELKKSADDKSGTIIRVYNDDEVCIYKMEGEWYFCSCNSFDGYIKAENVEFGEKSETDVPDVTDIPKVTDVPDIPVVTDNVISEIKPEILTDYQITIPKKIVNFYNSVKNIYASSQLKTETVRNVIYNYSPVNMIDNDLSTCWSEGRGDYGIGEEITIEFNDTYSIDEICIWNGLCTNDDLFYKNSRIHEMTLIFSGGESIIIECNGDWNSRQNVFKLNGEISTSSITFRIDSIFEGNKYKDTCISEISIS